MESDDNKPYLMSNIKPFVSSNIKSQSEDIRKIQNEENIADEHFIKTLQKSLREAIDENEKVSEVSFLF